jgi:predicted nucleic acid-binding protein
MSAERPRVPLVLDANVIIDLVKLGVLLDVARLRRFQPLVPSVVRAEVRRPEQAEALAAAIAAGAVDEVELESIEEQALMAPISDTIGAADAACLAAAAHRGGMVASDEQRGKFMREARRLVGEERLVRSHTLLAEVIAAGFVAMERLEGAVAALAATASTARDRDDVEHLERVLASCAASMGR